MLFLVADVIINMINRGMRNTKHTETSLPYKFFLNEIIAVNIMGTATFNLFDNIRD